MSKVRSFRDLEIWQLAVALAVKVYKLLKTFPQEEKYGIVAQSKDSVVSVSGNIAESFGRFHYKDKIKFLYNSRGSLFETESHLRASQSLSFISKDNASIYNEILTDINRLGVKINNYIDSLWKETKKSN